MCRYNNIIIVMCVSGGRRHLLFSRDIFQTVLLYNFYIVRNSSFVVERDQTRRHDQVAVAEVHYYYVFMFFRFPFWRRPDACRSRPQCVTDNYLQRRRSYYHRG